ncbi:7796_t:CDS:2, partial [Acaulospora morrowiae]
VQNEIKKLEEDLRVRQQKELNLLENQSPKEDNLTASNSYNKLYKIIDSYLSECYNHFPSNNLDENKDYDLDDITDRLLARLEATNIDDEKKTPVQPKVSENTKKPRTNRQQERKNRKAAKLAEMQREAEEDASKQVNMRE